MDDFLSAAPYGQACGGCARAKSKCFLRVGGSECQRCHRLGKECEPARKRKAATPPHHQQPQQKQRLSIQEQSSPVLSTRLEEKLDSLVSLLRSQATEKHGQAQGQDVQLQQLHTPQSQQSHDTPKSHADSAAHFHVHPTPPNSTHTGTATTYSELAGSFESGADPHLVFDAGNSVIRPVRPPECDASISSPIHHDVSMHNFSDQRAEEHLNVFRRSFVPMFPFVHVPTHKSARQLRQEKPFLWFVIMCLTNPDVSEQFAMEDTVWYIISQRIVAQHLANLDLLLGVICFGAWAHYFKKDKPFMTMLAQLAVSLATDLGIHQDSFSHLRQTRSAKILIRDAIGREPRTLEERRTMLSVFHLTSAAWSTYRKVEALRWTPYMASCLRILCEAAETDWDLVLATQVKCQAITNQLMCAAGDQPAANGGDPKSSSAMFVTYLLGQLDEIRQSLPSQICLYSSAQYYLYSAELKIRESILTRLASHQDTSLSGFHRLQDLDSLLTCVERWLAVWFEMPLVDWLGITVDTFAQSTHCLIVLFKLTTLSEPGWDTDEVRRRADVLAALDRSCETVELVPAAVGMVDADQGSPRRGLFFKTTYLLRSIKALILAEMTPDVLSGAALQSPGVGVVIDEYSAKGSSAVHYGAEEVPIPDELVLSLSDEPWLSDIWSSPWDLLPDGAFDLPLFT
ncbi:hypothetical protein BKA67DRAFT_568558 [Truncatella angustata]|uniref:Zn(2)-C6 fungal-type domain-containing protein n=1 Tax=Truncatella angustata TaxID=152316 RepID=A0A9P8UJ31_9PEZI|nr:uncharacterized protein BKA67DRAFT_568558 [Truncatella angustata]KAH6653094.1 hypothetical protein BKA67DRAFT_568558 [Truncatella angustata]